MKKLVVIAFAILAAAACGGAAGESTSSGTVDRSGGAPLSLSNGGAAPKPGANGTTAGGNTTAPVNTVPALQGPPVIRQAQLSLTVGSGTFDNKLSEVRTLVEAQGGYIAGTDAQANQGAGVEDSRIRTAVVSFNVPAEKFDTVIDQLSKIGTVQSEHISGQDVSAQYVDLKARLANAEAQRDAMLVLLKQATNINDIIAVQNQIGQITAQIEQLKGQIKYLDDNTAYSAITITLSESGAPAQQPASTDSWGFATALNEAAHNFVTTINYLVAALGAVGPFLVLLLIGYIVWRRRGSPLPRRA
ncbi:MAG TPA: DUF4349 domain-containing protein [Candidatus Dormibacteraeota bacterium]|jgi:hypothetical protein|nr:DUF4349 domain-containing protein [Candidatus Dormibacteraeota bacterium]